MVMSSERRHKARTVWHSEDFTYEKFDTLRALYWSMKCESFKVRGCT